VSDPGRRITIVARPVVHQADRTPEQAEQFRERRTRYQRERRSRREAGVDGAVFAGQRVRERQERRERRERREFPVGGGTDWASDLTKAEAAKVKARVRRERAEDKRRAADAARPVPASARHAASYGVQIRAFDDVMLAAAPVAWCSCTWVWAPFIGGRGTPWVRKFVNSSCTAHRGG
jgi:hypothetical protein